MYATPAPAHSLLLYGVGLCAKVSNKTDVGMTAWEGREKLDIHEPSLGDKRGWIGPMQALRIKFKD